MAEAPPTEADSEAPAPGPFRRLVAWWPSGWSRARLAALAATTTLLIVAAATGIWWWSFGASPARPAAPKSGRAASEALPAVPASSVTLADTPPALSATASAPIGAISPDIRPRLADAAIRGASTHFALVGPVLASHDDALAQLRRLQAETARIHHPTATQTSIVATPQGWRVSWWPFAGRRQAENAKAAMSAQRIALEVVDF